MSLGATLMLILPENDKVSVASFLADALHDVPVGLEPEGACDTMRGFLSKDSRGSAGVGNKS